MKSSILENTKEFRHFIEEAFMIFFLLDQNGTIIEANRYAQKAIGKPLIGQKFKSIIVDFQEDFQLETAVSRGKPRQLLNITHYSGLPQTYLFSFKTHGNNVYAYGQIDLDDLIKMENEILTLNQELSNLTRQLHKKSAKLQQFSDEKENLIIELQDALDQVKSLEGIITICSYCKSIKNDEGFWSRVESYINMHPGADFSHGICPKCAEKYHPDADLYKDS